MKPSERFAMHYLQPLPQGTGLAPRFAQGEYKGEKLHPDVARRMAEFRAIPSLYAMTGAEDGR